MAKSLVLEFAGCRQCHRLGVAAVFRYQIHWISEWEFRGWDFKSSWFTEIPEFRVRVRVRVCREIAQRGGLAILAKREGYSRNGRT